MMVLLGGQRQSSCPEHEQLFLPPTHPQCICRADADVCTGCLGTGTDAPFSLLAWGLQDIRPSTEAPEEDRQAVLTPRCEREKGRSASQLKPKQSL